MKISGLLILLSCFFNALQAQIAEYFHFTMPAEKVSGSLYNAIHFIDSRADTANLGHVYAGPAGRRLPVSVKIDLYTQCNWLLYNLTDSSAKNNELVFQLRKFEFDEDPDGIYHQRGSCALRADLYCKKNDSYFKTAGIDTLIRMKAEEVTALLFEAATNAVTQVLKRGIISGKSSGLPYAYNEILKMDSVDKSHSELYVRDTLTPGVYLSYESFRTQRPDLLVLQLNSRFGKIVNIKAMDKNRKKIVLSPKQVYAFVHGSKAYVSMRASFYALEKQQDDFYFIAGLKDPPKDLGLKLSVGSEIVLWSDKRDLERQLRGSLTALFKLKLDHVDGSFITINKIIR